MTRQRKVQFCSLLMQGLRCLIMISMSAWVAFHLWWILLTGKVVIAYEPNSAILIFEVCLTTMFTAYGILRLVRFARGSTV